MAEDINLGYGTGRRKNAIARVFLRSGSGNIVINGKTPEVYFPRETWQVSIRRALKVLGVENQFDFFITANGGGVTGQAGAVQLGIARALVDYDERLYPPSENEGRDSFRRILRHANLDLLTRDSRIVERKKYGLRKARRRPQYSKR